MPGSAYSGSSASTGSKRAKAKHYRFISHTSNVDENLFGTPNHVKQREEMLQDKWRTDPSEVPIEQAANARARKNKNNNRSGKKNSRETVQVITKDLIRNLIVPTEDPSGNSVILPRHEFEHILEAAKHYSKRELEAQQERLKKQKEEIQDASQERKNMMKAMDQNRRKNEKLNDLEEEAKEKAEHLLAKANEMRQEQEDEIKHLNELILNAKCHAIRDAQILEKRQVQSEMTEEEKRLDVMMEVDRQSAIRIQEEIEQKRKDERLIGATKILEQIEENEQDRLFELERKDQENIQMQLYIERMMDEDREKIGKKKLTQAQLREELNRANAELRIRKLEKTEQEKMEELKVVEYQKQKAEREAAYEKEQEKIRIEKEREVGRLRSLQERARDEQAERDALRAKRAQEQAEREWRKKEAEEALKKQMNEDELKFARHEQMTQKEHFLAVQAQRERAEFERVLRAQKELVDKETREDVHRRDKRLTHAEDVRLQIRQREQERIHERNNFFEEGVRLDEEARLRRMKLEEIKKKKLQELRDAGIPGKYLAGVERKINQPQHISA